MIRRAALSRLEELPFFRFGRGYLFLDMRSFCVQKFYIGFVISPSFKPLKSNSSIIYKMSTKREMAP